MNKEELKKELKRVYELALEKKDVRLALDVLIQQMWLSKEGNEL